MRHVLLTGVLAAMALGAPAVAAPPRPAPTPDEGVRAAQPTGGAAGPKPATPAETKPAPAGDPFEIPFEKYVLGNGLEVILHRDPTLPLVAVNVWYHVGPSNEPKGRSGFAHLFEHLMFEGSQHVGHDFDRLLESVGATNVNGTTSWDRTNYFETVPRHELPLALWLESDRMGFLLPALTQERLGVQRDVVKNERRQTYENSPYGPSSLAMTEALFPPEHPYHGAVIGSMEDISRAGMDDVRSFFRTFYSPGDATLTLAGDFDVANAKELIARYFGTLPATGESRPSRPSTAKDAVPVLSGVTRKDVEEPVDLARVAMGWITPPAYTPDDVVLDVVSTVLAGGRATRLYQELVVKEKVASSVSSSHDSAALGSAFEISAEVTAGVDPAKTEAAIDRVVSGLAATGPTSAELARAKRTIELEVLTDLQHLDGGGGESGRAGTLQRLNHYLGDPGKLPDVMRQLAAVSAEDVQRATARYLPLGARVVITTRPKSKATGRKAGRP